MEKDDYVMPKFCPDWYKKRNPVQNGFQPLPHRDAEQFRSQDAFIDMDEDGNVLADFTGEIRNAMSKDVWNGTTLRFPINPGVTRDQIREFLKSPETMELLNVIHAGHSIKWDGKNNVGRLKSTALFARAKLVELLNALEPDYDAIGEYERENEEEIDA